MQVNLDHAPMRGVGREHLRRGMARAVESPQLSQPLATCTIVAQILAEDLMILWHGVWPKSGSALVVTSVIMCVLMLPNLTLERQLVTQPSPLTQKATLSSNSLQ